MTSGTACLSGTSLNPTDYSNLLVSLAANNTHTGVTFDGGLSHYTSPATAARNATLIGARGWTITDYGLWSATPVVTSPLIAQADTNAAWSYQLTATNSPATFAAIGLPWGFTIQPTTGWISGTATVASVSQVTLLASNADSTGSATLWLAIHEPGAPIITSSTSASAVPGQPIDYTITASNSPATFAAIDLPAWLSVNSTSGVISGSTTTAGSWTVTLEACNVHGAGLAPLTITIADPAPITNSGNGSTGGGGCGGGSAGLIFAFGVFYGFHLIRRRRHQPNARPG